MSLLRSLRLPLLMLLALLPEALWGQYRTARTPRSEQMPLSPVIGAVSAGQMMRSATNALRVAAPTAEELRSATAGDKGFRTYTFAVERSVAEATETLGRMYQDGAGNYVWRAEVQAPQAKNIGLRLSRYALPRGGALFVTAKGRPTKGAFTEQNNETDSLLQIAPIDAETLVLEYEYPEGTRADQLKLPFRLDALFYGFRDFRSAVRAENFAQPGEPFYDHPRASLASLSCAPNAIAYPDAWKQSRSTLLLIVGGTSASTGSLINNTRSDGTPYVLTSAHCLNNLFKLLGDLGAVNRNASTTVFFFGFQSPLREGNVRPTEEQSLSGANLVGYNENTDMCLLRIKGLPRRANGTLGPIPAAYQPYFAGWNINESPQGPFVGIHHPGGSTKRYNLSRDTELRTNDYDLSYEDKHGSVRFISWSDVHWEVNAWAVGATAAGSSGSALFDKDGLIVGALTGGASNCDSPYDDRYWALKRSWVSNTPGAGMIRSLRPWLDPTNSGRKTCDGYDPIAPKVVQRLSAIYPDPVATSAEVVKPNVTHTPRTGVDAVGNELRLPQISGATILGAYAVFKSSEELTAADLPQLRVALQPFTDDYALGGKVVDFASSTLGTYARYDAFGTAQRGSRTLRSDSIELFFPAPDGLKLSLSEGRYLLSCTTSDSRELRLPLLAYDGPADRLRGWAAWTHHWTDGWRRSTELPGGAYWIDLLIETTTLVNPEEKSDLPQDLTGYYHGGALHLEGEELRRTPCEVRIYDLTGQLHMHQKLTQTGGRATVSVTGLVPGLYIAAVRPTSGRISDAHSIYFSHK